MMKLPSINNALLQSVSVVAVTLSLCGTALAQKGVRVGVAVSIPLRSHPLSAGDKGIVNGVLFLIAVLAVLAVIGIVAAFLCIVLSFVWDIAKQHFSSMLWHEQELNAFLPSLEARASDPTMRKIEIEQARTRKKEWEERTAKMRHENANKETQSLSEL